VTRALICAALLAATGAREARADAPAPPAAPVATASREPAHVLSVPLWSLQQAQGISVEYEQMLPRPHWSAAGVAGLHDAADGDYSAVRISLGGELRYWFRARSLRAWYLGFGLDFARSRVTDDVEDRQIGSTLSVAESVSAGYRFVPWRRLEITPSVGFGVTSDFDLTGRLPAWHRGTVTGGITVGWMY